MAPSFLDHYTSTSALLLGIIATHRGKYNLFRPEKVTINPPNLSLTPDKLVTAIQCQPLSGLPESALIKCYERDVLSMSIAILLILFTRIFYLQ